MIKFKNINGDVFLAVGSIKRKSALNGEKSLTGTLFEGDDVLNKIDKGWSLEFDNEPYVVTYFERNDNDNTVEFDAIHKFFWDMTKDVLYFSWSGSHTAKAYLEQIFKDTGYQYALNFEPSAFEKDNWGMKNKLSLFNDVIDSMGGEFEINGTLVSIFKNVGSDLSTIVRHGFNLSDMSLENDNTDFVTYGEGFGAYADQENQTGERLHVTYTSPLAKTFGKLHAEPIDDQRYTIKDNLLQAIKDKVDGSFAISIKLSLYDLTAAGYPYKMANVGDWLLAIDENLDFKQKIRIISVDDEFATDGTRISYTVTCGDIGVVQKYQQANASLGKKVDSAYQNAQDAKASSIQAVIAANGKNTTRWFDSKEEMDAFKANEGDMAFLRTGDGEAMYIYTKMPDGSFKWVKRVDPDTGEQIAAGVDLAIETAQSQAAAMDEVQADNLNKFKSEHAEQLASATAISQSAANSAADEGRQAAQDAKKYADSAASEALSDANTALSTAKQELGSEVSKAQSDIVNTQTELAGKVSHTDFDTVTGDLNTKYDQVKITADTATADLASYKQSNDESVSANTAAISATSQEIKSKVSQTDYDVNKQAVSNSLSKLSQRADGFDLTVTKVDNLSAGDRNYILDTGNPKIQTSNGNDNQDLYNSAKFYKPISEWGKANSDYIISFDWKLSRVLDSDMSLSVFFNASPWQKQDVTIPANKQSGHVTIFFKLDAGIVNATQSITSLTFRINSQMLSGSTITYSNLFMKAGNIDTTWTPAPEDTDNALAVQQTAITANADAIKLKASQTDLVAAKNEYTTKFAAVDIQAGQITDSVTKLTGQMNDLGQINQLFNTEFSPDKQGWYLGTPSQTTFTDPGTPLDSAAGYSVQGAAYGSSNALRMGLGAVARHSFYQDLVPLYETTNVSVSIRYFSNGVNSTVSAAIYLFYYDANKKYVGQDVINSGVSVSQWLQITKTAKAPTNTRYVSFCVMTNGSVGSSFYAQPMMVFDTKIGTYVQGSYNNNGLVQSVRTQLSDSITQEITDRTTGDKSVLAQTDKMISSQIADYNLGVMTNIAAMADGVLASVGNNNLVPNSEFQPTNIGWRKFTNSIGSTWGDVVKLTSTTNFNDWPEKASSNGVLYHDTQWIISEPVAINGSVMSASIIAGRTQTDNNATQSLDMRIAYFDSNKKMIGSHSFGNIIEGNVYKGLQTYKLENRTPTTGAKYAGLVIAHSGPANDIIYQPMLNFGSNALKYSPTYGTDSANTILQLFKDNWAIGITDNAFEIVSGIVGDNTSMNLISNNITLRGNTTVTEDFYAKGGNFKNLNASNITTGTINASKINVINLDVSSLSGNITNFIKSYWNSAYSSVKIDSSGMVVSTDSSNMAISDTGFAVTTGRSVTELSNGKIDYTSDSAERIGYTGWLRLDNTTVDYLSIVLKGWHTTKKDDIFWKGGGKNFYGGDGIKFGITNSSYGITDLLVWNSQYASSQTNYPQGWTMLDDFRHFGNEEKYGNLNLHGHFDVPGSYQALQFRPIVYNGTTYPAMMGSDKGTSGGAILFGSEEIYLKHGNNVVSLANVARKAGYNI
ncbi:phage tail protein [Weissella paramesenteroides]